MHLVGNECFGIVKLRFGKKLSITLILTDLPESVFMVSLNPLYCSKSSIYLTMFERIQKLMGIFQIEPNFETLSLVGNACFRILKGSSGKHPSIILVLVDLPESFFMVSLNFMFSFKSSVFLTMLKRIQKWLEVFQFEPNFETRNLVGNECFEILKQSFGKNSSISTIFIDLP